jgi:hypothetical protein
MEVHMNDDLDEKDLSQERKMAKVFTEGIIKELKDEVVPFIDMVKGGLEGIKKGLSSRDLSYEEVMNYFISHKNDKPGIVKGALLKEDVNGGFLITQTFLDKDNKIVVGEYGRSLGYKKKVSSLDKELQDLFKNENLIIVE